MSQDINKKIGDFKELKKEIDKTITSYSKLIKTMKGSSEGVSNSKKLTEVNRNLNKAQKAGNAIQQENKKLLNQRNTLITKQAKELQPLTKEVIKQREAIKAQNAEFRKQAREELGLNKKRSGLFRSVTKSILAASAAMFGFQSVIRVISNSIKIIANFEQAMSKVKAVTGATGDEFKALQNDAKRLGSITAKSATQVASLQLSFAKLGFSTAEILNATEATISLSIAAGEDLAESATIAASTLKAFGLDAEETQRVVDVMAKSFSSSALDLEKFRESMKLVAPIAKAANIDLETTTALLSSLANAGLSGSIAGTGLKNVISKLSNENSALSKELGFTVKNSEDLIKAFKILKDRNIDLTKATELTDERSKAAFITMVDGIDTVEKLQKAYVGAEGSAKEMADIMEDNLIGDVTKLSSAWEGFVLSLNSGEGIISRVFRRATQNVTTLVNKLKELNLTLAEKRELRNIRLAEQDFIVFTGAIDESVKSIKVLEEAEAKRTELIKAKISELNTEIEENLKKSEDLAGISIEQSDHYEDLALQAEIVVKKLMAIVTATSEANKLTDDGTKKTKEATNAEVEYIKKKAEFIKIIELSNIALEDETALQEERLGLIGSLTRAELGLIQLEIARKEAALDNEKDAVKAAKLRADIMALEIKLLKKQINLEKVRRDVVAGGDLEKIRIRTLEDSFKREEEIEKKRQANLKKTSDITISELQKRNDADKEALDARLENEKLAQQQRQELLVSSIQTGANEIFDLNQSIRATELSNLNAYYAAQIAANEGNLQIEAQLLERQIDLAEGNQAKQVELEEQLRVKQAEGARKQTDLAEELRVKQAEIARKQAISERNQAIFNIAITTIQEALKIKAQAAVFASNPLTAALAANSLAQLGLLLGTSAASVGAILAQPLPGFFTGTENAPAGLAWVAEKGRELVNLPNGESFIAEKPMLYDFKGGEQVKNNFDTESLLNGVTFSEISANNNQIMDNRMGELINAVKNNAPRINIDKNGLVNWHDRNRKTSKYINDNVRR